MNILLIDSLGWTLLHFLWQGTLIGIATALVLSQMDSARPQARYAVACAGLLACLLWPAAELTARLGASGVDVASASGAGGPLKLLRHGQSFDAIAFLQSHMMWVVGLWAVCALLLAVRMGVGLLWVERVTKSTATNRRWETMTLQMAERFGIGRKVELRVVDGLESPMTAGWLRPVVLLPAALVTGMPTELLSALLAHEMAHVRRFDYLVNLGQSVVEALLFFHPAVWWISRRIRTERELVADALAAEVLGERRVLATALSELERFMAVPQLAQAANGGDLVGRIRALLKPEHQALNWKAAVPVVMLAVAAVSMGAQAADDATRDNMTMPAVVDFSSCAKPVWPAEALARQQTGTVTMRFKISRSGAVVDGEVAESSGHPSLDKAALDGIKLCKFKPGIKNGVPYESWMHMKYMWVLE